MRAFFGAVIAIGIAAVASGLFCAVYTVGEYIVETEYEKRYGAQNWEEKRRERKKRAMKELKCMLKQCMLKLTAYIAIFAASVLFGIFVAELLAALVL